ncbi:MAG: aminotransferase class V-fold PLP-dependent enzyme, partial [Candidatus Eremiobacteraeota bacterium]|nr:aminotransferase class V-fold PLP-dependent enzyme [Candidatus Eremiobacteraeota bacterium]
MNLAPGTFEQHGTYLNTATYGLPPRAAFDDMAAALEDWRTGRTSEDGWEGCTERARASFARIVGVRTEHVAIGATVSELLGLIAASLPNGARVLAADNDFSSTLFPFAVHADRNVTITSVPLEELVSRVSSEFDLIVVSHVQAQSGMVLNLEALTAAAKHSGPMLCIDGTQSCGWLPTDAASIDFYVCHAYKWLLGARGAAFLAVRPDRLSKISPLHAGWYATDDPNNNLFSLPPRLSSQTRR